MTNEEKQEIVAAVLQSLKTNSATIDQLTEVGGYSGDDYVELNKGRKIKAGNLAKGISGEVLQEAREAVAKSRNYADKSEESAGKSSGYSDAAKGYAEEAKKQAGMAAQSGELAQYAKEQGDYAKEQGDKARDTAESAATDAVGIAEEAARKVTNDVLFKTVQSLTEEEQEQVLMNLNIGRGREIKVMEWEAETQASSTIISPEFPESSFALLHCLVNNVNHVLFLYEQNGRPYFNGTVEGCSLRVMGVYGSASGTMALSVTLSGEGVCNTKAVYYQNVPESKYLGQFVQESQLPSVTSSDDGKYAYVGNPRHVYSVSGGEWVDMGESVTVTDKEFSEESERPLANSTLTRKFKEAEEAAEKDKEELSGKMDRTTYVVNVSPDGKSYELADAVAAVPEKIRKIGLQVRFLDKDGKWRDVSFVGNSTEGWNVEGNWKQLSGEGTGSGFYNVTKEHPLPEGYYTLETAVQVLSSAKIEDDDKPGKIITFEVSPGKWEDYRFEGSDIKNWSEPSAWARFGGGDSIRKIRVTKGTSTTELEPDGDGAVYLDIPQFNVEQSVNEGSTDPVSGKAVALELKRRDGMYGVALQLNEIGEGDDKVFSLSLLNQSGEVISTSDQFSGGGGSALATKVILTRVTSNLTVKAGDEVRLTYKYDHVDSLTGESTGNPAKVSVTVTRGVNTDTIESSIYAGSTNTLVVTEYMSVGTNTVRVRVQVGEGEEMQVSQITWTINVIQLTLTSSFNIATLISRGDVIAVPYALSGAGNKTLRCYVDGVDTEDRSITSSTANGSLSIPTDGMAHGTHTVQFVVELELSEDNVIKSNSIYFAVCVCEEGNRTPVICARFDYPDGSIIPGGSVPYIQTRQFDMYTLVYTAYNPREPPTRADVYVGSTLVSSAAVPFTAQNLTLRATGYGEEQCRIVVGSTTYSFRLVAEKSGLNISEPTDGLTLKLSAQGRSNSDVNREEWSYNDIRTVFEGFKWGGDGWTGEALRLTDTARATVQHLPLAQPEQNVTNAMAFIIKYKVSEVVKEDAEVIRCVDADGTGFVITAQEARMATRGNSELSMKMAAGETYEVAFVSFPKSTDGSSEYEKLNTEMVYLYINGIMSGSVQRSASDSVYQATPAYIELGAEGATTDVYLIRAYNTYLSDSQVLDCYMVDQSSVEDMFALYDFNNVVDENGNVTVDSVPDGMRYLIITGRQDNGVPTVLQAAVNNDKDMKYDVDEMLCVVKGKQELNFKCVGGCIRLQGTSSLAYPIKNYRIYFKNASKVAGQLYLECDGQGVGGELQEEAVYSFRLANGSQKQAAPVDCFCLKADFAESSSSHNTGMAKLVQNVLTQAGELTPAQRHCDVSYPYDVRTTVDGEPCYLFYRGSVDETPQFLGKFNFNNDKSTEAVFGFLDIPGYHDQEWVNTKFGGQNPTECWEFLNNDYPMGMFLDDDFTTKGDDGTPNWLKVFEARFPDDDNLNAQYEAGTKIPANLQRVVSWVKSTQNDGAKFKNELADYFDVDYLCDYYMFTDIMGCVDQRVKNMMMAFWYDPDKDKTLAYMIFYDCDTILGVRNDGRLKYGWDVDENTADPELSTEDKTVYAYAGHDSVLWKNLREQFPDELEAAYRRIREKMSNSTIFNMFDTEQSAKFCERIYNLDAQSKYVGPKTLGVEVNQDGSVSNVKYSYLEAMQGNRKAHRHWWVTNRMGLFDARYSAGQYTATDISFKGNSAAGATVKATPARDFYFEFRREGDTMVHEAVTKDAEWSYTYGQMANIGTIFHLYGGEWMKKLDLGGWGGFTDMSLPNLPVLEELILGNSSKTYALTELVLGAKLPMLRKLDVVNYTNLPSLDLSGCNRLEEVNAAGCTSLSTVTFAEGAAVNRLHLPQNFQTLVLRSMQYLSWDAITFDGKSNLTGIWIENCALIDGLAVFRELFSLKGRLKYVRITGLELEGDGSDLKQWYDAGLGGLDASGNTTNSRCKLVGTYRLTKYLDEETYGEYVERFDELNIRQPEYTVIEFDDTVADDANVSNPDNGTGYRYGNRYVPSAHLSVIFGKRRRVLAKLTRKPTSRKETIAGQEVDVNNTDGEMTFYPLHDLNSNYYADAESVNDCTAAGLDGSEGEWMMYEPFFWSKGVNDYLNGKHYSCYSSNGPDEMPSVPEAEVMSLDDIKGTSGGYREGIKIMTGKPDLESSYSSDSNYSVCRISVAGYRRVRFPSVPGTNMVGSVFTDAGGGIVEEVIVQTINCRFEAGMYLIKDVPEGAAFLYFSVLNTAEFDKVVLSNSGRIEDMEPDWVPNDEHLCAVVGSSVVGSKLRACITGGSTAASLSWNDFHYYSQQRGMQQIDALMHFRIANLFYAFYGRRDSQEQCGAGQHTNMRVTGGTAGYGMQDTVGYEEASKINPDATDSMIDGLVHQYAWYREEDEYGKATAVRVNNVCCLGYEDIFGNKYEMMDGVDMPNDTGNQYKWRIWMPDGSIRMVQGMKNSDWWITGVSHGKYMDVVPVGTVNGSSSTYYTDKYWVSGSACRVVYRGCNNASAVGGVSGAYACNDASYTNTSVGSRLAFRGKIVMAESAEAFKSLPEIV